MMPVENDIVPWEGILRNSTEMPENRLKNFIFAAFHS
jgi:hypothetical protein